VNPSIARTGGGSVALPFGCPLPTGFVAVAGGALAWAQILGTVLVTRDGVDDLVPHWTTGVFGRESDD
jgi:hypothetical protein